MFLRKNGIEMVYINESLKIMKEVRKNNMVGFDGLLLSARDNSFS